MDLQIKLPFNRLLWIMGGSLGRSFLDIHGNEHVVPFKFKMLIAPCSHGTAHQLRIDLGHRYVAIVLRDLSKSW